MKKLIVSFILALFLQSSLALAGEIRGKVLNQATRKPVTGAAVKLVQENRSTVTDAAGRFVFRDVAAGTYSLQIKKRSYKSKTISRISVWQDKITRITIKLRKYLKEVPMFKSQRVLRNDKKKQGKADKEVLQAPPDVAVEYEDLPASEEKMKPHKKAGKILTEAAPPVAQKSGLRAAYADDNRQFNYFLHFLEKYKDKVPHYPLNISERIKVEIVDSLGKSVPGVILHFFDRDKEISHAKTYADGSCYIYPAELNWSGDELLCRFTYGQEKGQLSIKRDGPRKVTGRISGQRKIKQPLPVDLLFILDTTGSMGEEIERLKQTIELINMNISSLQAKLNIRYGMILYRDKEDEYVTRRVPFTADLQTFSKTLQQVRADGGGDTPEDLQSALKIAVREMDWNKDGLRLAFVITDASAHLDYETEFTYATAARLARREAIRIFTIGTGGLAIDGEYVLRQIAQFTGAKYIFLTYGEKGESEGGSVGSVSHHTGSNYQTDKLESIIIRFTKEELANLIPISIQEEQPYFQAKRLDSEAKEKTLQKLFTQALQELLDFSTLSIASKTTLSIIPIAIKRQSLANNAEYFTERLTLALRSQSAFTLIERKDLQYITKEIGLQLSGILETKDAAKVGRLLGAEMLLIGNIYFKDGSYELYLKLLRVSTAEVLSVTKLKIDPSLGL